MPQATSRSQWLESYDFPLEAKHDFLLNDKPAEWASGHPKVWGGEHSSFQLPEKVMSGDKAGISTDSAMSPDKKLLAISCDRHNGASKVLVYDVESKELRQTLDGTGQICFRPEVEDPVKDDDNGQESSLGRPSYTLISSVPSDPERGCPRKDVLTLFDLDKNGRLLDEEEPVDTSAFATKAIDAILPDLEGRHEWSRDFVNASELHQKFERALAKVAADHGRRHNTTLQDARLFSFGARPFSPDGKYLLYQAEEGVPQQGTMGDARQLPQIVVWDIDAGKELYRLSGHKDVIMWAGFSPNNQHVASISWDGTMRMYSASTGSLSWVTEDGNGQCWSGDFSPDSKHIVWSSMSGMEVKVLNVEDGKEVAVFGEKLDNWCRCLVWHPDGQQIALCAGGHAYIWRPFDGPDFSLSQHYALPKDDTYCGFVEVYKVGWLQEGRKLHLMVSDGTSLVWDTVANAKEVFKRPKETPVAFSYVGLYDIVHGDQENGYYISADGDGKVRYWRTSVAAFPSWWEHEKKEEKVVERRKKQFPETGPYVNITK